MLKNQDTIEDEVGAKKKLEEALQVNQSLSVAYYLKEELKLIWQQRSKEECEKFFGNWVATALGSGIRDIQKFAKSLLAHRSGIFNWYDYKLSTGPLEGFNNKIKVMKRQAYGYRDKDFFKLKIYALHKTKYALTG
ncbi:MAG: transposase family protein [Ignavibacteria bacterium]|nr:transposase family protein [Ignavibacteria bacterium]